MFSVHKVTDGAGNVRGWAVLENRGKKLIVQHNGKTASRTTRNAYQALVVAEDADGKLLILSAHFDRAAAYAALAKHNAGKFVNFNYRKAVTTPEVIV